MGVFPKRGQNILNFDRDVRFGVELDSVLKILIRETDIAPIF